MRTILLVLPLAIGLVSCSQKPVTPSQAQAEPPKFTQQEVAQSLALLSRESQKGKAKFAALDAVRASAPYVSDFVRLFPTAKVNYRYFTPGDEPGFDVEVDLYERYELVMQLPARFDAQRRKVVGYGDPQFYLREVEKQEGRSTWYAGQETFGSEQWGKVVGSGGDFSAIGFAMKTNQPVPGFKDRGTQP